MTEQRHHVLALHALDGTDDAGTAHEGMLHQRHRVLRRAGLLALAALLLLGLGAGRMVLLRQANAQRLQDGVAENTKVYVKVAPVKRGAAGQTLQLPGTLAAQVQAPINARAAGYLKRWHHDIGAKVAKGALLAEIDSPELDQQLGQAVAAREQAAAALALARSTADRWEGLRRKDVVSQQELDEKRNAVAQQQANLAAAQANERRLQQLAGFKRVVAPFAGVVIRRNVDTGDLIDPSRALFVLAQTDTLRLTVNLPQAYTQIVKPGLAVQVSQAELRGQRFAGQVVRTAGAIDPATRTLPVEIALPNKEGLLLPGAFVQVALPLAASGAMSVPTNALMFRAEGSLVAVVDGQGKVALKKVAVGRNAGPEIEVTDGLQEGQRVVLNPPDWMADGLVVTIAPDAPKGGASAPGGKASGASGAPGAASAASATASR